MFISNNYVTTVTATNVEVGGIVGEIYASATLTNCKNAGVVKAGSTIATSDTGTEEAYAGNLVGHKYNK